MNGLIGTVFLMLSCVIATPALAQQYPAKPIRMVIGIAPGGGFDTGARAIAASLSSVLGQQVFVENRPGAGGTIGASAVASAVPDGYTLLYSEISLLIAPSLYEKLTFDPLKSFTAVAGVGWEQLVLSVHPAVQARTAAELIALLKANPGKYAYGSPGVGTPHHLTMEMFKKRAGVTLAHVPYKGAAMIVPDLLSGVLPIAIMSVATTLPQAKAGKLRPIAVTSPIKLSTAPDWPPLADTLPGFDASSNHFVLAPAGTPAEVIARLSEAFKTALSTDDLKQSFLTRGATAEFLAPAALTARLLTDVQRWGAAAKESGIKLE